jgi:hypothetical protein
MEELQVKWIQEHENQEHHVLENISLKMERIKATQQKNRGRKFKEPNSHNVGKTT